MRVICVDDERLILNDLVMRCSESPLVESCAGFKCAADALEHLKGNPVDLALLDINMPGMSGMDLAQIIRREYPATAIIFTTAYSEYALEAFALHADGYLLKPVRDDALDHELAFAHQRVAANGATQQAAKRISVQTFGNFEVLVDGQPVHFHRSKCREILAYLVDKRGVFATRREISGAIWENDNYDDSRQAYLNTLLHTLKNDLDAADAGDLLAQEYGRISVNCDAFDCDLYRLLSGDAQARASFRGEYLTEYPWADVTLSEINEALL